MKKITIIISIIILLLITQTNKQEYYVIPEDSIRLRILANSNSIYDQYIKNKVKQNLEQELKKSENITTIETARTNIKESIPKYKTIIQNTLEENNYNKEFKISYGNNYFPQKEYKGVIYKEGEYESLLITLGEGKGNNWWCVLYPPICTIEVEEQEEIEYKFFIKELFDKYIKN